MIRWTYRTARVVFEGTAHADGMLVRPLRYGSETIFSAKLSTRIGLGARQSVIMISAIDWHLSPAVPKSAYIWWFSYPLKTKTRQITYLPGRIGFLLTCMIMGWASICDLLRNSLWFFKVRTIRRMTTALRFIWCWFVGSFVGNDGWILAKAAMKHGDACYLDTVKTLIAYSSQRPYDRFVTMSNCSIDCEDRK